MLISLEKIQTLESKEEIINLIKEVDKAIRLKENGKRDGLIYIRKKLNSRLRKLERK